MRPLKITAFVLISAFLSGCTAAQIQAMDSAGGIGVLTDKRDQFDGTRRISLSPSWVSKSADAGGFSWTAPFKIGAQWNENLPDTVAVIIEMPGDIQSMSGLGINVDGSIEDYQTTGPTQFETNTGNQFIPVESSTLVLVPLDEFIDAVNAESVQMRLYMPGNQYSDADFGDLSGTGGAPTARQYLKQKFLPAIEAATAVQ